jgi:PHD/YefM family antitoxin component YafN of YafNO toxin-antitoxin module
MCSHEVFTSYSAELNQEEFEQKMKFLVLVVERPQLPITALKKGFQMVYDLDHHLFETNHFMHRCLKFKHKTPTVMMIYKEVYKAMQKKAEHLKITPSFIKSSVSHSAMHSMPFYRHDNFQPGMLTSLQ